jgi:hypothetical protein
MSYSFLGLRLLCSCYQHESDVRSRLRHLNLSRILVSLRVTCSRRGAGLSRYLFLKEIETGLQKFVFLATHRRWLCGGSRKRLIVCMCVCAFVTDDAVRSSCWVEDSAIARSWQSTSPLLLRRTVMVTKLTITTSSSSPSSSSTTCWSPPTSCSRTVSTATAFGCCYLPAGQRDLQPRVCVPVPPPVAVHIFSTTSSQHLRTATAQWTGYWLLLVVQS